MNLIDENIEKESEEKQKKITKIIIITIIVLILIVLAILAYSAIKKKNTLTLSINGKNEQFKSEMFIMEGKNKLYVSENGDIYFSVRELANKLGVGYFNDEYKGKGEDTTKCYIKTDNEYTSYISGSSKIYKVRDNKTTNEESQKSSNQGSKGTSDAVTTNDYEYEYFEINDGVRYVNNEIYASKSAIELGFNVSVSYNEKNRAVSIYTLDGLLSVAKNKVGDSVVSEEIDYYNKKLLKYGLVLIKNSSDNYGIADYVNYHEGEYVLSCKYSKIKFVESLGCIIVTTADSNEQGILKIDLNGNGGVKTIVDPKYQEINQLTEDGTLYVTKEAGKYGIIKVEELNDEIKTESILKSEYQTIGLENYSEFEEMTTRYLINDNFIPIKRDDKWGIVSRKGEIVVPPQFDTVGCVASDSGKSVVCIPELKNGSDAIVFGTKYVDETNKNQTNKEQYKYLLYIVDSKTRVGYDSMEIYSTYENNERSYYMKVQASDGSIYRINVYEAYGEGLKSNKSTTTNTKQTNTTSNNTTTNTTSNTTSANSANTNTAMNNAA